MESVNKQTASQSQKLMVFVLTMALYGLATLFSELIPKFQVGIVEFSVEYFLFIPLTLAMLFDPMSAALGAATGELVFSEIMLGQFGGLGEVEKFLTVTIGVYVAGRLVRDPSNRVMVGVAAIGGTALQLFMGTVVDILKVQFAIEDFEAVAGLPEHPLLPAAHPLSGAQAPRQDRAAAGDAAPHPENRTGAPGGQGCPGLHRRFCCCRRHPDAGQERYEPCGLGGSLV